MNLAEKLTLSEIRNSAPSTGYVDAVEVEGADQSRLSVVYPDRRVEVSVAALPDTAEYRRPSALQTVLAVQIRNADAGLDCTVLGSSPEGGPVRVPITISQALRAAGSGIRTVLVTG